MKLIIAGSRSFDIWDPENYGAVVRAVREAGYRSASSRGAEEVDEEHRVTEVVSGGARGGDRLGEDWAAIHRVPVKRLEPDWDRYGKRAGIIRNEEMGRYADALVALWDGKSRGTEHMIEFMRSLGKPVYVKTVRVAE